MSPTRQSTERGVWGGKSISVFSVLPVAESYKKQIQFSIIELKRAGFNVLQQQNIKVYYENQVVGNYFVDIIADQIILEIKSAEGLKEENKAQLINYSLSAGICKFQIIFPDSGFAYL